MGLQENDLLVTKFSDQYIIFVVNMSLSNTLNDNTKSDTLQRFHSKRTFLTLCYSWLCSLKFIVFLSPRRVEDSSSVKGRKGKSRTEMVRHLVDLNVHSGVGTSHWNEGRIMLQSFGFLFISFILSGLMAMWAQLTRLD